MTKIGLVIFAFVAFARVRSQQCSCNDALNFPGYNVKQYGISKGSGFDTPLTKISACFWLNMPACYVQCEDRAPTMISYASSSSNNDFTIWSLGKGLVVAHSPTTVLSYVKIADAHDHHVCVTWDLGSGPFKIYVDGTKKFQTSSPQKTSISSGGTWVIGQDQDEQGGGFEEKDSMKGMLAEVNVFDRILCPYEIAALASSCGPVMEGNVKSQKDFDIKGGLEMFKPSCCLV